MEKVVSYQPALIMSLLEKGKEGAGHHPSSNIQAPEWCKCGQCREMPTEVERKCCGYVPKNSSQQRAGKCIYSRRPNRILI